MLVLPCFDVHAPKQEEVVEIARPPKTDEEEEEEEEGEGEGEEEGEVEEEEENEG